MKKSKRKFATARTIETGEYVPAAIGFGSRAWTQCRHSPTRRVGGHAGSPAPLHGKVRGVFHCFGGSLDQANEVLDLDHLVSFTELSLSKTA